MLFGAKYYRVREKKHPTQFGAIVKFKGLRLETLTDEFEPGNIGCFINDSLKPQAKQRYFIEKISEDEANDYIRKYEQFSRLQLLHAIAVLSSQGMRCGGMQRNL